MPTRPKTPCNQPGCPSLVSPGQRYCPDHKRAANQAYRTTRGDTREQAFYKSGVWRRYRAAKLAEQPLCERCERDDITTVATIVHHKEEIKQGGDWLPTFDESESVCAACHNQHKRRGG